jgi:sporulation related protein
MRTILVLLLLANLTLFGYTRLDGIGGGEAVRLTQQVLPDKIKLLAPREVAALGPTKVAALADVCIEWGPFSDADRTRAMSDLAPLALGSLLSQRRQDVAGEFGVMAGGFTSRAGAERRASELRAKNVADIGVQDQGGGEFGLTFGVFHTEDAARARIALLDSFGTKNAKIVPRQQTLSQTLIVVRDPQAPTVSKLKDLQLAYPGADLKIGGCDKAA